MGFLRLLLALTVVASHTSPTSILSFVGGRIAVEMFFVISGFYMQMVLSSGRYQSATDFYISRFLRIFPTYWIVSLVVLIALDAQWISAVRNLGASPSAFIFITQATLFFQDAIFYLKDDQGSLSFTLDMWSEDPKLFGFLLNSVSWTLALELYFYLLAPFLARRSSKLLLLIIGVSTAARVGWYAAGFAIDPWVYRFFPFEISLFVCGMLSYRLYERVDWKKIDPRTISTILWAFAIWFAVSSRIMPPQSTIFMISMAFCGIIPLIFFTSRNLKVDRLVGELSYPVYLIHYPLAVHVLPHFRRFLPEGRVYGFLSVAGMSILLAFVTWRFIDKPIDDFRHRMFVRRSPP